MRKKTKRVVVKCSTEFRHDFSFNGRFLKKGMMVGFEKWMCEKMREGDVRVFTITEE